MNNIKKSLYILSWIPILAVHIILILMGLVIVPAALMLSEGRRSQWPDLFWLWGNNEEFVPLWWLNSSANGDHGWIPLMLPRFWWFAIRNPVNNLRFLFEEPYSIKVQTNAPVGLEPKELMDQGLGCGWKWSAAGWKAGYRLVWLNGQNKYSEIWVGWKLGSSVPGLGFTFQVRLKREIE